MKRIVTFVTFFVIGYWLLVIGNSVEAKVLPRFRSKNSGGAAYASGVIVSPRLRGDRLGLIVTFSNLSKANSVQYTLIYDTNGKQEGVGGTISSATGNSVTRELIFGTCSSGVCRYHTGISNMRLEVISELTNGKRTMRRFRIRI